MTVKTSVLPSYKFKISPLPLWVIAAPTVELFAATSSLSTSVNTVSSVVVVPLTVRSPVTVAFPVIAASLTVILSVSIRVTDPVRP